MLERDEKEERETRVTWAMTDTSSISRIKEVVLARIPEKYHPSLSFVKVEVSSQLNATDCIMRISRFEFKCSGILNTIKRTSHAVGAIMSKTSVETERSFVNVICIIVGLFVLLLVLGLAIFVLFKRRSRVKRANIVELSCESSTSSV